MNVGRYRNVTGAFYTLVFGPYLLKVKSNFDDLGVVGKLVMRATTFILGVRAHFVEKVVKNLGFYLKPGSKLKLWVDQKFKEMALAKKLFRPFSPICPNNYLQYPYFILCLVPHHISLA